MIALVVLCASPVVAGDLDNAKQFWQVVNGQLGGSWIPPVDTLADSSGAIMAAVNSCIRKVASHIGIMEQDTITVVDKTFRYTLNANFIEDGIEARPFSALGISADGENVYGLLYRSPDVFSSYGWATDRPQIFTVRHDQLWIAPTAADGDVIYVGGPAVGLTMADGGDTTNVLDQDRSAVCDCAAAMVGFGIGHASALSWWDQFLSHVRARGGTVPTLEGP